MNLDFRLLPPHKVDQNLAVTDLEVSVLFRVPRKNKEIGGPQNACHKAPYSLLLCLASTLLIKPLIPLFNLSFFDCTLRRGQKLSKISALYNDCPQSTRRSAAEVKEAMKSMFVQRDEKSAKAKAAELVRQFQARFAKAEEVYEADLAKAVCNGFVATVVATPPSALLRNSMESADDRPET